jgi:beta-ureidopropionase / N-carbamoyl-L-amino-acid hydrolase
VDARGARTRAVLDLVYELGQLIGVTPVEESLTYRTTFDRELTAALATTLGGDIPTLPSGAGHDAGVLALAGIPSAMILVRNPSGISHAPDEYAEDADVEAGVAALAAVIRSRQ